MIDVQKSLQKSLNETDRRIVSLEKRIDGYHSNEITRLELELLIARRERDQDQETLEGWYFWEAVVKQAKDDGVLLERALAMFKPDLVNSSSDPLH